MILEGNQQHAVRSFVRRNGRMSLSQRQALQEYWAHYGLSLEMGMLQFDQLFGAEVPVHLEIGFGMGQSLIAMAEQKPEEAFIGVEVHQPGIGKVLNELTQKGLNNVRLFASDAIEVLINNIADNSLTSVLIFFPDPWQKQRHHKRRLIQPEFLELAISKLKKGGYIHLATDWQDYARQMMKVLSANPKLQNSVGPGLFLPAEAQSQRPRTKFELRGKQLGHEVSDMLFMKI